MNTINKDKALELIKESNGKMFSVVFTKKDGTKRLLNGRTGVKKGLTGKGMAYDPTSKGLFPVYDMKVKGFRMINLNTVQALKINKIEYVVTDKVANSEVVSLWNSIKGLFQGMVQ